MKAVIFIFISLLLFQACSSPQPNNRWQYQATSSLHAYTKHYLEGNTLRAKADLAHAREEASKSVQLHTLIDIELSVCATNISVLEADPCDKAFDLLALDPDPTQKAYLDLLSNQLSSSQVKDLPQQYQDFATFLLANNIDEINDKIQYIEPISSRVLASALIKDQLTNKNIQELTDTLSYYGYKTALLAWLKFQIQKEDDLEKKEKLMAKLKVLISH